MGYILWSRTATVIDIRESFRLRTSLVGVQFTGFLRLLRILLRKTEISPYLTIFWSPTQKTCAEPRKRPSFGCHSRKAPPLRDSADDGSADRALAEHPRILRPLRLSGTNAIAFGDHRFDDRDYGSQLFGSGVASHHPDLLVVRHSGMFPCFFGGKLARLVRRARRALTTVTRVAAGSMTPSSSPRSAARNGLATL